MGALYLGGRRWRQARQLTERNPLVTTAVLWLMFFCVMAVRRPGSADPSPVDLPAQPDDVPYIPSEDPMFELDEHVEIAELTAPAVPPPAAAAPAAPAAPAVAAAAPAAAPAARAVVPVIPAAVPVVPALVPAVAAAPTAVAVDDAVHHGSREILSIPEPSPTYPNGLDPLSCFTEHSSAEQRTFSEAEKAMFRHLFDWPETVTSTCKRMLAFGGLTSGAGCLKDGDKYACLDPPLELASARDCLVYSFGINYDWSFDEAMERFGCEVHSFDPTIDYPEGKRSPGITFHHIGIGRNNHTNVYGWRIHTLDQIVKMLGHEGRTIHYLKMDAEGGEFDMLAQQLTDGSGDFVLDKVEQIGFEIHYRLDPRPAMSFYRVANRTVHYLKQLGFNVVKWEYNKVVWQRYMFPGVERPVSLLYEILLVRNGDDSWDRSLRGQPEVEPEDVNANFVETS